MSRESKKISKEIQKGIMVVSKHLRSLEKGKIQDEDSQYLIIEIVRSFSKLNMKAFNHNENHKVMDKISKELERLQNKLPKKVLKQMSQESDELVEIESSDDFDEDAINEDEFEDEIFNKNPSREEYDYEFDDSEEDEE